MWLPIQERGYIAPRISPWWLNLDNISTEICEELGTICSLAVGEV
jgi:hypothetical protein